jgi:hypothetical protein
MSLFDATSLGSPMMLDKGWRVGITANPAAAAPILTTPNGPPRRPGRLCRRSRRGSSRRRPEMRKPGSGQLPQGHQRPFAWFRLHIKLAPNHGPSPCSSSCRLPEHLHGTSAPRLGLDVFANGKPDPARGPNADAPERYQQISRIYNLNLAPSETSLTLVVRTIYVPFGLCAYTNFFPTASCASATRKT